MRVTSLLLASAVVAGSDAATLAGDRQQCRVVDPSPRLARGDGNGAMAAARSEGRAGLWERGRKRPLKRSPWYSATRTLDIELGVEMKHRPAPDARVELRLLTPAGHLYQALRMGSAEADALAAATSGLAAKGRRPAPPRWPRVLSGSLPVAGTSIVNHSLYGGWMAEPWLDGEPCGEAVRFWIGE
jgi:hypothetical protein